VAGATIPVHDPASGEIWPASLFVMVLGASSYTYAEATRDQQLTAWLSCHIHAFEYFGGVPRLTLADLLEEVTASDVIHENASELVAKLGPASI
jgi:transposase